MDAQTITTIISLISGIVGGNLAGMGMAAKNLGPILNTVGGLIGGGAGKFLLTLAGFLGAGAATGAAATGAGVDPGAMAHLDLPAILASIGAGGVGGGALTAILTYLKDVLSKNA